MKLTLTDSEIEMTLTAVREMINFWMLEDARKLTGRPRTLVKQQIKSWGALLANIERQTE